MFFTYATSILLYGSKSFSTWSTSLETKFKTSLATFLKFYHLPRDLKMNKLRRHQHQQ